MGDKGPVLGLWRTAMLLDNQSRMSMGLYALKVVQRVNMQPMLPLPHSKKAQSVEGRAEQSRLKSSWTANKCHSIVGSISGKK